MARHTSRIGPKFLIFPLACAALLAFTFGPMLLRAADVTQQPSAPLIATHYKFEGATGCNAAKCHGSPTANPAPKPAGNEFNTWSDNDNHTKKAYKALEKDEAKKILAEMKQPGTPQESPLCTNCHALVVPADQQMSKYNVSEGVTCGACHGPYEKWEKPHNQAGGADGMRKQCGYQVLDALNMPYSTSSPEHQKLLKDFGLFDTRPILARAEKCSSCHLAIDAKMVAAGHPTPLFELAYYSDLEPPHWREPQGYWATKVWAAGQVVCLRDAMNQLAERAADASTDPKLLKDAYSQAMGHLLLLKHLAGGAAATQLDAVAKDLQAADAANDKTKLAAAAKTGADVAGKMMTGVATLKPDAPTTAALIGLIAKDTSIATVSGFRGAQQQAFALNALRTSFLRGGGQKTDGDALLNEIGDKLLGIVGDSGTFKPGDFAANLATLAGKLGATLPAGTGAVPAPVDIK
jgi:hypothetical protein